MFGLFTAFPAPCKCLNQKVTRKTLSRQCERKLLIVKWTLSATQEAMGLESQFVNRKFGYNPLGDGHNAKSVGMDETL